MDIFEDEKTKGQLLKELAGARQRIAELERINAECAHFEEELSKRAAELEAIFVAQNDAVLIFDTNMNVLRANHPFLETYGLDPVGLNVKDIIKRVSCRWLDGRTLILGEQPTPLALRGEKVTGACYMVKRSDGTDMVVETSSGPMRLGDLITGSVTVWHDITERSRAEESLRKSEQRFHDLFSSMSEGFALHEIICDEKGKPCDYRFIDVNPAFEQLTGLKREDVVGKTVLQVLPDEDPKWIETYGSVALTGEPVHFENYSPVLNRHYGAFSYRPAPNQFAVIFMDITQRKLLEEELCRHSDNLEGLVKERTTELEARNKQLIAEIAQRKKAENALRLAGAYNRSLIEASLDPLVTIDVKGRITDVNKATEKVTGRSRRGLINTDFSDYFTEPEKARSGYKQVFSEGMVQDYPLDILHSDGHITPVLYNAAVYHDQTGNVLGVFAAARNITERKQMEEKIRKAAHDWQITFDSIKDHVMILDNNFKIDRVNAAAASFFNLPHDHVVQNNCFSLMHCSDKPIDGCPLTTMLKTKKHEEVEHYDDRRDMWFLASVDPVVNDKGEIIRVIHTVKDITERKRAEEEKKRLESRLIQAQKIEALGKLAGGIAHDFNNVLQPILINSELISDILPHGTQEREYIDQIIDAAHLGKNLIRQIKLFGSRKGSFCKPITIGPVVQDALNLLKRSIPSRINFRQWITSREGLVRVDPTQIHQLILNLCNNAIQAMKSGKGFLGVSIKETEITSYTPAMISDLKPGRYLKLTVRDTGSGISRDIRDKIFDPFFTTKKSSKGTGLGLAVVHELVKNANGSILLSSDVGKGAKFEVYFPQHTDIRYHASKQIRQSAGHGEKHILLADDNEADLRSLHQLLIHLGYQVTSTSDPQEALNIFKDEPKMFSLVITDQVMPRMRGHELAGHIRKIRQDIPVILCSGSEEIMQELQEKKTGINEFILKPFSRSQLQEAIGRVLT